MDAGLNVFCPLSGERRQGDDIDVRPGLLDGKGHISIGDVILLGKDELLDHLIQISGDFR